jgi:hypothetical protein
MGLAMNTNSLVEYSNVKKIGYNSPNNINKKGKRAEKQQLFENFIQIILWLLTPESSEELPISVPNKNSALAGTLKTLFWIMVAIGTALLIAQLGN